MGKLTNGKLTINGTEYAFSGGETILDVAQRNGVHIPVLCYLKEITPTGACRLCLIEVDGVKKPLAACVTYAVEGMSVKTDTEMVKTNRKMMLDFILAKHPLDCPVCDKAGECLLQDTAYELGVSSQVVPTEKPEDPVKDWEMFFYNQNLCVLCERCVKVCHEITGCSALKMEDRGFFNHIIPTKGANSNTLGCDYCGTCVDACPVGALLDKSFRHRARVWDLKDVHSTCTLCPVGCTVEYGVSDNTIIRAKSVEGSQVCAKGRYGFRYLNSEDRISTPMLKREIGLGAATWEEVAEVFKRRADLKGKAAVVAGSRLTNEALAAWKRLAGELGAPFATEADFTIGSFMAKYAEKFGHTDTVGTLDDVKQADLIFVIGSDLARESVGVKWRVMNAVVRGDARLVTIGLREYEYAYYADANILADYGDFAGALEKIKTSDDAQSAEIREYIKEAKKVAILTGNEYFAAETQQDAIFSFADIIGQEKLSAFLVSNDRANFAGALLQGGNADAVLSALESGNAKLLFTVGCSGTAGGAQLEKLKSLTGKAEIHVAVDMFQNPLNKTASVFLPAKGTLETIGTTTTMDGRVARIDKVVEAPEAAKSDVAIASFISTALNGGVEACVMHTWNTLVSGTLGFPAVTFDEIDGSLFRNRAGVFKPTAFTYAAPAQTDRTISVNPRYHAGVTISKANYSLEIEGSMKKLYLDPETAPEAGAKGIKLQPKL